MLQNHGSIQLEDNIVENVVCDRSGQPGENIIGTANTRQGVIPEFPTETLGISIDNGFNVNITGIAVPISSSLTV